MPNNINTVRTTVNNLHEEFNGKYGFTIFNLEANLTKDNDDITISGDCLTAKQVRILKRVLKTLNLNNKIRYNINVLHQDSKLNPHVQAVAGKEVVNVTSDYNGKRLTTQITPDDPPMGFVLVDDFKSLILLVDSTLGWVKNSDLTILDEVSPKIKDGMVFAKKGEPLPVASTEKILAEADAFIDKVSYLHGGRSMRGIDCSAFVQIIFKRAFDITLPRHTLDQMKYGVRVAKDDLKEGDLLFAKKKGTKIMHVGIVSHDKGLKIIHSCLNKKRVILEEIGSFFDHYSYAGARRVIKVMGG